MQSVIKIRTENICWQDYRRRQDSHYSRLPDTREQAKKTKNRAYHFEEDDSKNTVYSPIIEVMESLPVFDQIS